jgi:hypothetical protein
LLAKIVNALNKLLATQTSTMEHYVQCAGVLFVLNRSLVNDIAGLKGRVMSKLNGNPLNTEYSDNRTIIYKKNDSWDTMSVYQLDINLTKAEVILESQEHAALFYSSVLRPVTEFLAESIRRTIPKPKVANNFQFSLTVYRPVNANTTMTASTPILLNLIRPPVTRETVLGRELKCEMTFSEYRFNFNDRYELVSGVGV